MFPELVILVGAQGAGKSSFYRARFAPTHALISKDLWPNLRRKDARQEKLAREHLSAGRSVVVDNTHATRAQRAALFPIARACGARVTGYYFDVTPAQSPRAQRAPAGPRPRARCRASHVLGEPANSRLPRRLRRVAAGDSGAQRRAGCLAVETLKHGRSCG